jgi:AraC-like DNA-binding protein
MAVSRPISVNLPAFGVMFAESVHGPEFHMAERADGFHKLIYVLHGGVRLTSAGAKPAPAGAGAVLGVPAGVRHCIDDTEPSTLLLLCFDDQFLDRDAELAALWARLASGRAVCLRPGRAGGQRFEALWRAAIVEQSGALAGRGVALRATAENVLLLLARLPAAPAAASEARQRVEAVARELAETFYEPWSLERGCVRAGMSRRHFSKLFRAVTGRTFLEQVTELRLEHAARLLREGRHSVIGAAFSSGYGDLSHFYRLFRQRHGHPPKAWADRARAPSAKARAKSSP